MADLAVSESEVIDYDDLVLSSVHLADRPTSCISNSKEHTQKLTVTKFTFEVISIFQKPADKSGHLQYDDDGDMIVERECSNVIEEKEVTLCHSLATPLADVGKKLWLGSLLLSDWILHNPSLFTDTYCLELGAGLGLCSIIAGIYGQRIFCTDVGESVLKLCQRNIEHNSKLLKYGGTALKVRELDWLCGNFRATDGSVKSDCFAWTDEDINDLKNIEILLAADVIYDNALTEALFSKIISFMEESEVKKVQLFLSVEKRLNFTIEELDIACPAYDYFKKLLNSLESGLFTSSRMHTVQRIDTNFPKYFDYERVKELELWQVTSTRI